MGLGIKYVILANHLVSLITSSTTDPWYYKVFQNFSIVMDVYLRTCVITTGNV